MGEAVQSVSPHAEHSTPQRDTTTLITLPIRLHCLPYIADDHELRKESTATKALLRLVQATNIGLLRPGNWLHVTFVRG